MADETSGLLSWASPGAGITNNYDGNSPTFHIFVVFFCGLAMYNAGELVVIVFLTFKRFRGLYFWSLLIAGLGIIPYTMGFLLKYMNITTGRALWLNPVLITLGWYPMVTGQSVVLWSRLHLIVLGPRGRRILTGTRWMIILNVFVLQVPTTVMTFGVNGSHDTGTFQTAYNIMEKIQMIGFFIQEVTLSSIYIIETVRILRLSLRPGNKKTMKQLIFINVVIIVMDLALLAMECASLYILETLLKGIIYSIKLKLEFAILGKLIKFVRSSGTDLQCATRKSSVGFTTSAREAGGDGDRDVRDFVDLTRVSTEVRHPSPLHQHSGSLPFRHKSPSSHTSDFNFDFDLFSQPRRGVSDLQDGLGNIHSTTSMSAFKETATSLALGIPHLPCVCSELQPPILLSSHNSPPRKQTRDNDLTPVMASARQTIHSPIRRSSSASTSKFPAPGALPRWILPTRQCAWQLPGVNLKVVLAALCCVALGFMSTLLVGTSDVAFIAQPVAPHGVLDDFSGVGGDPSPTAAWQGIIGYDVEGVGEDRVGVPESQSTISGALTGLRQALKGKLQSWNSCSAHTPLTPHNTDRHGAPNITSGLVAGEEVKDGMGDNERLGMRTRIGKCTILFNGNSFWERAIRTHERHNQQHGYRLHILRQHLLDDVWSKPAYILSLLLRELARPASDRLDWLLWFDADTVLLNPYIPIETFLPPPGTEFDDVHLVYSNDWNGLNNGVFPIRVNQWAVQLFAAITAYRHFRPDEPLEFRDQSAMDCVMHEPAFVGNIIQAPQRWFNAYQGEHNETLAPYQIRRGDFLVHFAGVPAREERMANWLERAEQHLDEWEVPLKSTSYPQEVRDFWAEQRRLRQEARAALAKARLQLQDLVDQVDQQLSGYSERLGDEQKNVITGQRDDAMRALAGDVSSSDRTRLEEATRKLETSSQPLILAMAEAQKLLLQQAHEAIMAGERELLAGGSDHQISALERDLVAQTIRDLKDLVMTPQEHWDRQEIIEAMKAVNEARADLQETLAMKANPFSVTTGVLPALGAIQSPEYTLIELEPQRSSRIDDALVSLTSAVVETSAIDGTP